MTVTYDKKRTDITFCTMLFKMPQQSDLNSLKHMDRKFEDFYLPSLKKLCETFGNVVIWCDQETEKYLQDVGLADKLNMHVIKIQDLPHWKERKSCLEIMYKMKKYVGYFLHRRSPEMWQDYLPLTWAKPAVIDWAAQHNKFKSDYFMWVDAGAFSPKYADSAMWNNWTGRISAKPERVRMTIAVTLGKSHPHFVPRFLYDFCKFLFVKPIQPANAKNLMKQNLVDIAMINADYDVPAGCFIVPQKMAHDFYNAFERSRKILKKNGLVCVEQGIFQTMMKFDTDDMFELKYIRGYDGLYAAVAAEKPDILL